MLQKPENTVEEILRNLKKQMQIADVSGSYYVGLDPMCRPDQRIILAVWVLLKFIDYVDPMDHYPAVYPSQLFFLKENIGYEIVVLYEGEQSQLRLLQPQEDLKYIIIVHHIAMAEKLKLPDESCLFATVDFQGGGGTQNYFLFLRATSQVAMLAWTFGDCREGGLSYSLSRGSSPRGGGGIVEMKEYSWKWRDAFKNKIGIFFSL